MNVAPSARDPTLAGPARTEHLYAIDLLRFTAALAVVLVHWCYSPPHQIMRIDAAKYGLFGVQLFFLISGFVILMSAQGQGFREFIVARLVRLYPAFWICCTISALFCFQDPMLGWAEYLANMTMLPNPFYTQLINEAYWSLVVEAKFYLLIAVLILSGRLHRIEPVMWAWILACTIANSFLARKLLLAQYAPFFIGGCVCFLIAKRPTLSRWALLCLALAAAMRETALEVAFKKGGLDTFTSCAVVASFFILMLAVSQRWLVLPRRRSFAVLGAISYPLYLLHQRIAIEIRWTTDSPVGLLLALGWIVALSYVVHRWGEAPLQRWLRDRLVANDAGDARVPRRLSPTGPDETPAAIKT